MPELVDMRKTYHTRQGQKAQVLTVSRKDPAHPVIALIDDSWVREYDQFGNFVKGQAHELDLIAERVRKSVPLQFHGPYGMNKIIVHYVDGEIDRVEVVKDDDEKANGV